MRMSGVPSSLICRGFLKKMAKTVCPNRAVMIWTWVEEQCMQDAGRILSVRFFLNVRRKESRRHGTERSYR